MKYSRINLKAEIRRRRAAVMTVSIMAAVLAGLCAAGLLLERPTVSELENRELEKFPKFSIKSYLDGSFAEAVDRYFTDTVPFRDALTQYAAILENIRGIPSPQFYGVEVVNDPNSADMTEPPPLNENAATETSAAEASPSAETAVTDLSAVSSPAAVTTVTPGTDKSVTETAVSDTASPVSGEEEFVGDINEFLNNGIIVNGVDMYGEKAGIMLFGGNDKQGERYANLISAYKKQLGDGVNVYNLVVPTSVEFYLPKRYSRYSNSEKDEIDFIYSKLSEDVIPVDAYSVLEEHKDEYIYFRTDHHWTDLGAYYAYTAFCGAIGQTPPALADYTAITKEEPFVGSLYGYTSDVTLKNNPDVFTYYKTKSDFKGESFYYDTFKSAGVNPIYHEYATGSNMYGMFLGSDSAHVKITTSAGTGRKIVMFKESYGNAFAPYLIDSFDEIYVIDIRYFGRNAVDYIKQVGATDVLFINNVFAANTSMLINGIERMMTSPTGTIVTTTAAPTETTTTAVEQVSATEITPTHAETSVPAETTVPTETTVPKASETKKKKQETVSETEQSSKTEQSSVTEQNPVTEIILQEVTP